MGIVSAKPPARADIPDWRPQKTMRRFVFPRPALLALLLCLNLLLFSGCNRGVSYEELGDVWVPEGQDDALLASWQLRAAENTVEYSLVRTADGLVSEYEAYVGFRTEEGAAEEAQTRLAVRDLYWLAESIHGWLSAQDVEHFGSYTLSLLPPSEAFADLDALWEYGEGVAEYSISTGRMDRIKSYDGSQAYGAVAVASYPDGEESWLILLND